MEQIGRHRKHRRQTMNNYEQHNETFHFEMDKLEQSLTDPDITCMPTKHIRDMWSQSGELMKELDLLEEMGTNIPSLTLAALRLRAQIFIIPEQLNIDNRAQEAQHDTM